LKRRETSKVIGEAIRSSLENHDPAEEEILLYAAGPVGNRSHLRAEIEIRAFIQSSCGPIQPSQEELIEIPRIGCRPISPRLYFPMAYTVFDEGHIALRIHDWLIAPLGWRFTPEREMWLQPDRQVRGIYLPAARLFPDQPIINSESDQLVVKMGEQQVAHYHYWNDELRERDFLGSFSRVGGELVIRREWLD
jgi:hypothetical protein